MTLEGELRLLISQMDVTLFQLIFQNFLQHLTSKSELFMKKVSYLVVSISFIKDPT